LHVPRFRRQEPRKKRRMRQPCWPLHLLKAQL
jgi:hypothetical protein